MAEPRCKDTAKETQFELKTERSAKERFAAAEEDATSTVALLFFGRCRSNPAVHRCILKLRCTYRPRFSPSHVTASSVGAVESSPLGEE